ncbi:MAG: PadR family transcriptional regulator [Candidatus Aenigmarchaeota archaeon]|nr:PadR family transcriptional regulator [Candidatus Aenigmarchaeota archaeon]
MKRKYGCDMRGMLSFHILWLLSKKPMHGEQLAEEIGNRRGEKPKPGTIYPALKDLKEKRLIKGEKKGKTVVYSITPEGRKTVRYARDYFCRAFEDIFEHYKKIKPWTEH